MARECATANCGGWRMPGEAYCPACLDVLTEDARYRAEQNGGSLVWESLRYVRADRPVHWPQLMDWQRDGAVAVQAERMGLTAGETVTGTKPSWVSFYALGLILVSLAALAVCIGISAIDRAHEREGRAPVSEVRR